MEQVLTDQTVIDGAVTDAGVAALVLGGDVRGRVRQADGSEVRIAMVEYRPVNGDDVDQVTANRGNFHIEGLKPGKYLIRARDLLSAAAGSPDWSPDHEVEVKAGETASAEIALSRR